MTLFAEFLRNPRRTGTIAASSPWLARELTRVLVGSGDVTVVELGPGTGSGSDAIQRRLAGRGRHIAVESNARLAATLAADRPAVDLVVADAADLRRILDERDIHQADVIVSGLPWSSFPADTQAVILGAVAACLGPDGTFTTFTYVHAPVYSPARRFRRLLGSTFGHVETSRVVWRNLPPAIVYTARGAHRKGATPPLGGEGHDGASSVQAQAATSRGAILSRGSFPSMARPVSFAPAR